MAEEKTMSNKEAVDHVIEGLIIQTDLIKNLNDRVKMLEGTMELMVKMLEKSSQTV